MTVADLDDVNRIAETIHVSYPEDASVLDERLALHPDGCHVLETSQGLAGYLISHPWRFKEPPALNTFLRRLPSEPTTYYIHDLALLAPAQNTGTARGIVQHVLDSARAAGFTNVSLIAVNRSTAFWQRMGFVVEADPSLYAKLRTYDADAVFMVHRFTAPPPS
jgi:GNAT superfamily N-acetyltransferase